MWSSCQPLLKWNFLKSDIIFFSWNQQKFWVLAMWRNLLSNYFKWKLYGRGKWEHPRYAGGPQDQEAPGPRGRASARRGCSTPYLHSQVNTCVSHRFSNISTCFYFLINHILVSWNLWMPFPAKRISMAKIGEDTLFFILNNDKNPYYRISPIPSEVVLAPSAPLNTGTRRLKVMIYNIKKFFKK